MIAALLALALTATPAGPPPPVQQPEMLRFGLAVHGRLKAGASLRVSVTETFIPSNPSPTRTGGFSLCYQHGTSRRLCSPSQTYQWTVQLESGADQFLTLRVGDVVVARVVYRGVRIAGPPARGTAPLDATPKLQPAEVLPATVSATGGLNGLKKLHVGSVAYFWWSHVAPATLCYKHGSSRVRCRRSALGGFYVTVQPGHDQYFSLKEENKVRSRLVYHHVT